MSKKIKKARDTIRTAFNMDDGFKEGYIANVAMAIYDEFPQTTDIIGTRTKHQFVNDCAKRILNKIFYE